MHEIGLIVVYFLALLYSIIVHEVAHGVMALRLGDLTAKYAGRLTLNPVSHIDPWGSIVVPLFLLLVSNFQMAFGWAKPVPYNPNNLRNQRTGSLWVALAGPGINLAIALVSVILANLIPFADKSEVIMNLFGGGSGWFEHWGDVASLISGSLGGVFFAFLMMAIYWNVILAFFNLIPVPPLDGSKILYAIFPFSERAHMFFEQYGMFFLLFIILFFSGPIDYLLQTALITFFNWAA